MRELIAYASSFDNEKRNGGFMMNYGIAIFPSKKIQDEANALRKRYDPQYTKIPPHVTLKSAFTMDEVTRDQVIQELKKIANDTKPFTIHISKVSSFAPVTHTIYFKVEPIPELTILFDKMHSGIFPDNNEYSFVPHITLAQDLMEDEYSDVYSSLRMKEVGLDDTVDRFQLCYQLDDGSWTVYESFVFGQETT